MKVIETRDRDQLANFFQQDPGLHAYSLGDLDPLMFPHTRWWVAVDDGRVRATLLCYTAFQVPILHGITDNEAQGVLWSRLLPELPSRAYVHFLPRHAEILRRRYRLDSHGPHFRMRWQPEARDLAPPIHGVRRLTIDDVSAIRRLYADAMPNAHFDANMAERGRTFGWFESGNLVSVASSHVFSEEFGVTAIGGVATLRNYRGRGFGTAVTWALTDDAARSVPVVVLNVATANVGAIRIYERIGYAKCAVYEEAAIIATDADDFQQPLSQIE